MAVHWNIGNQSIEIFEEDDIREDEDDLVPDDVFLGEVTEDDSGTSEGSL